MRVSLDCHKLKDKIKAHQYLAQSFNFPDYYGNNLDALWDVLTTIHQETEIILANTNSSYQYAKEIVNLLNQAADYNSNLTIKILEKGYGEMKFAWVTLQVNNMDESIRFYQEIVGLNVARRFNSTKEMEICFLGSGETKVELIDVKGKDCSYNNSFSIGFTVDSLADKLEFLKEKGIENIEGPFKPNQDISYLFIKDPNGVKIQFAQMKN